jgi:hypothetical protein
MAGLVLCACPEKQAAAPQGGQGIRLALPDGWEPVPEGREVLHVGPRGRTVLSLRKAKEVALPTAALLAELVKKAGARPGSVNNSAAYHALRFTLTVDGGAASAGYLGAVLVNGTVFLCSSEPGATDSEIELAEGCCAALALDDSK